MCPDPTSEEKTTTTQSVPSPAPAPAPEESGCMSPKFALSSIVILLIVIVVCGIVVVAELGSLVSSSSTASQPATIVINPASPAGTVAGTTTTADGTVITPATPSEPSVHVPEEGELPSPNATASGTNVCAGKKPDLPDAACVVDAITNVGPQAGANVTKGYQGKMEVDNVPIKTPYWMNGMCPVNVHWHLGAEHLSVGEYDENGGGPTMDVVDGGERLGHQCTSYNAADPKFTTPYEFKYCNDMEVGQTYEVHWPHSAAGACGTPYQYQTPFYDGVFCTDGVLTDTASQVGVQAQVFIVVNDESYFWPDLMRGMIVEGDMGTDLAKYTGSTTGDGRNNEICSQYSPITWQVDRKCHMISASSFDKLCYDMLQQSDDMSEDTHPHGARETVADKLAANNHANRFLRHA